MKLVAIICAVAAVLLADAIAGESRTPAQWVAQLDAKYLEDRDAASAALLELGIKAREEVRNALASGNPEIQSRAKKLWKTLRWRVVPGAEDDTRQLVEQAELGKEIPAAHWEAFVKKYGAESIRLVAEFRTLGNSAKIYLPGLHAVMGDIPPGDIEQVIAQTARPDEKAALVALLDELTPEKARDKTAANWMQIQIALWNYDKAYAFGRDVFFYTCSIDLVKQCAIAADRGGMMDKIREAADQDIKAETDGGLLCVKLSFYTALYSEVGKKSLIEPLFDLPQNISTADADDASLQFLVETLLNAGMPSRAVKVLHNVQTPLALYMRSIADMQIEDEPVAAADWHDAMVALDEMGEGGKKEALYKMAVLMNTWHDNRAGALFQKILSLPPLNTAYDANACFALGQIMEQRGQYAQAADLDEKGLQIDEGIGGMLVATSPQGDAVVGEKIMRERIKNLRALSAGQNSVFTDHPPANPGATPQPQGDPVSLP